ncbi:MAG: ABC transporter permease [Candidatus Hodarchaeales archaeon]
MGFSLSSISKNYQKLRFELGRGPTLFILFVFIFFGIFLIIPIFTIMFWSVTSSGNVVSDLASFFGYVLGQNPTDYLFKPFFDIFLDESIWGGSFSTRVSFEDKSTIAAVWLWSYLGIIIFLFAYYRYIRPKAKTQDSFLGKYFGWLLWGFLFVALIGFIFYFWTELKMIFDEPIPGGGTKIIIQGPNMGALLNSLLIALATTVLSTVFGVFFAFIMARYSFPAKDFFRPFLLLPLIIPPFVSIIGFHRIMGETGILNILLYDLFNTRIVLGGSVGIVFVQFLHFYTLVYLNVYSSLVNIDPSLEESAENLGAKGFKLTRTITLPLAMPGLAAGSILAFILAIEDLGTPLIFSTLQTGDKFEYMPTLIFHNLINLTPRADIGYTVIGKYAALSAILVVVAVIGFIIIRRFVSLRHFAMISKGRVGEPRTSPASKILAIAIILILVIFLPIALIPHIGTMIYGLGEDGFLIFMFLGIMIIANIAIFYYLIKDRNGSERIRGIILLLVGIAVFIIGGIVSGLNYIAETQPGFRTFLAYFGIGEVPSQAQAFREGILTSLWNMFLYSFIATLVIVIIATVTAYLLVRKNFPGKELLDTIVTLPLAIPGIIIGFGYFIMFYNQPIPIIQDWFNPAFNPVPLLIIGYTVRKFTFTIRAAFAGMQQVDVQLEEASFNLGASRLKTLRSVTVPMIAISVFAGGLISLVYCMSEVSTTIILLDYTFDKSKFGTATWKIWDIYGDPLPQFGYPMAAVLGIILMFIQAASIFMTNVILKSRSEALTGI